MQGLLDGAKIWKNEWEAVENFRGKKMERGKATRRKQGADKK